MQTLADFVGQSQGPTPATATRARGVRRPENQPDGTPGPNEDRNPEPVKTVRSAQPPSRELCATSVRPSVAGGWLWPLELAVSGTPGTPGHADAGGHTLLVVIQNRAVMSAATRGFTRWGIATQVWGQSGGCLRSRVGSPVGHLVSPGLRIVDAPTAWGVTCCLTTVTLSWLDNLDFIARFPLEAGAAYGLYVERASEPRAVVRGLDEFLGGGASLIELTGEYLLPPDGPAILKPLLRGETVILLMLGPLRLAERLAESWNRARASTNYSARIDPLLDLRLDRVPTDGRGRLVGIQIGGEPASVRRNADPA